MSLKTKDRADFRLSKNIPPWIDWSCRLAARGRQSSFTTNSL